MRHDIPHHLNTINALLQAGDLKAASEYSEQLLPMQTYISRLGKCKNPVVEMRSCTAACRSAEAKGVPVQADVSLPVELPVSNTDLIVAFGNLLDNALEACSGIPDAAGSRCARTWIRAISSFRQNQTFPVVRPAAAGPEAPAHPGAGARGGLSCCSAASPQSMTAASGTRAENDTYTVTLSLRAG